MALPFKKTGKGSFLNGVSGVINSITFKAGKKGKRDDGSEWQMYSGVALITPDGGKPTEQFLGAGFLDDGFSISKDGRSIEGPGTYELDVDTQLGKFVVSLVEGPGTRFADTTLGDLRNYDAVAGTRATFKKVVDEELTKELGPKKGKPGTKNAGKDFPREDLLVAEIISLPDPKKAGAKPKTAPKAKATAPAAAPAAPAAAPAEAAPAVNAGNPDETLQAIIAGNNGTIELAKLSAAAIRFGLKAKMDKKGYEALRDQLTGEEYLAGAVERGVIAIEGEGKERVLIAA